MNALLPAIRKITTVSDSLTNDEPTNYLSLLGRALGVAVAPEAHGGWTTTSYFRERLQAEAFARLALDADLCLLLIGSNNLFEDAGGSEDSVRGAVLGVQRIADYVQTRIPGVRFLLVAPPNVCMKNVVRTDTPEPRRIDAHTPVMLGKLSAAYRELAAERGWLFADLFPVLDDDDFLDAAHPTPEGNRKMAEALLAVLRPDSE